MVMGFCGRVICDFETRLPQTRYRTIGAWTHSNFCCLVARKFRKFSKFLTESEKLSICMTVPAEPLITPCHHLFCRTCINQALSDRNICPIDRRPCTVGQLRQLEGLSSRIWSGIQVKCGGHDSGCAWRGSIADYSTHVQNYCSIINRRSSVGNNSNNSAMAEEELDSEKRRHLYR